MVIILLTSADSFYSLQHHVINDSRLHYVCVPYLTYFSNKHTNIAATTLSSSQEILEYMADNLMHFLNPTLVLPHLMNHSLLTEEDAGELSCSSASIHTYVVYSDNMLNFGN